MTKFVLKLEDDYDFYLIGLSCHHKDYRLCYELNKLLEIDLVRDNDLIINKQKENASFSFSLYIDDENHREYYLIANKGTKGYLVPEQKTADFFLMVKGVIDESDRGHLVKEIKALDIVLAAYAVQVSELKSRENLLF
jgi:hypothetical protein